MAPLRGQRGEELGPDSPIPDKLYFKIGEVSKLVGVQAHVLRYWQSEIPAIRPSKSASNQRRYRYRDIEIFREIRRLLYEERYTLAGARKRVLSRESHETDESTTTAVDALARAVAEAPVEPPAPASSGAPVEPVTPATVVVTVGARGAAPAGDGRAPAAAPAGDGRAPVAAPADGATLVTLSRPGAAARPAKPSGPDDELVQRLRRGLKDLIRLAGEEP